MVSRRRRRARGMTLVEVMIALLITVVGLLAALAMLGTVVRSGSFSRRATEASVLAQSRLESLVSMSVVTATNPPDSGAGSPASTEAIDALGNPSASGPYTRTTAWSTTPDARRRVVTVTVSWLDSAAVKHAVVAARQKDPQ